ncbi:MAG TPA: O-antigen ligase [Rhizomicrobium sp.]|jgi:O-antigen ligase|nr:O-antigen ligase [Rhizomicrobium sp.]
MASDVAIRAVPQIRTDQWIAEAVFVAYLLLVIVTLTPFAPRPPEVVLTDAGGQGDALRQIAFVSIFAATVLCAFRKFDFAMVTLVPFALLLLLGWCLLSATWAAEGAVTLRRGVLEVIVVLTAILSVEAVGIERSLKLLRAVLIGVLVVDLISPLITSRAVHLPGEQDPSIVGAWRGLHYHKNIAGSMAAISAMLFLFFAMDRRSRIDWLLFFGALVFLFMTKSKSSLGLLAVAIGAWMTYAWAWRRSIDRTLVALAVVLIAIMGVTAVMASWTDIENLLNDPQSFTGRTAIWGAELAFIGDHPIFGAGYGSFTDTGGTSPLHDYVGGDWVEAISQGHNGYLQLMMELGLVGFALAMIAIVVQPAIVFWRRDAIPVPFKAFLFGIFVFMVLHNFMESDTLQGEGPAWVPYLMMLSWLRQATAITQAQNRSVAWQT